VALVWLAAAAGCRDAARGGKPARPDASQTGSPNPAALGRERGATLAALERPYRQVARALGAHQLTCKATLGSRVGARKQELRQKLVLRLDAAGGFAATKNIGRQQGQQLIWTGGWLYPRLRYSRFTRRHPRPGEVPAALDRMAGYLPAYVRLLEPFLSISPAGKERYQGRGGRKVKLGLNRAGAREAPAASGAADRWRRTVVARAISGSALLDTRTGAPLRVELKARWSFVPPPAGPLPRSGIPGQLSAGASGTMELSYSQQVTRLGSVPTIKPPPADETLNDVRRRRLDLERQIFTGEIPMPGDWRKVP
jgi:hypothetical protein